MRRNKCEALMTGGVTIIDPDSTFIDVDVHIGPDTVIHPSVQIQGQTFIGEDVTIHSGCRITNSKIGAKSIVLDGCIIVDSTLGEQVSAGPYAHVKMNTVLADTVKVGNFVEIKKSSLGAGTKSMHLTYLGDATIGKGVNIGAGTITCNYDGFQKHPTIIDDGAFIGTDSQLIAPVRVGKNAYVAAGSSITDDVPPDSLAIARGRQAVKEGWVKERKKKKQ
jgi:bifunctional UDP-N-acetylglucosamine pyrophosphorylase/glucosamine-1-phosphate N-acetyltransferase